jgi:hypothetical protein
MYYDVRVNITGMSAYLYYMRAADAIHSHKPEDRDIIDKVP